MSVKCWRLNKEVVLLSLLEWCLRKCSVDRLLVVNRCDSELPRRTPLYPESVRQTERIFSGNIIDNLFATAWPGSELIGHSALVYRIGFHSGVVNSMAEVSHSLWTWNHNHEPSLPEDLCLYRSGSRWPTLVTVTHEQDGWIIWENVDDLPWATRDVVSPKDLLIPEAKSPEFLVPA